MKDRRNSLNTGDLFEKSGVKASFWDYLGLLSSNILLIPLGIVLAAMTTRILGTEGYGYITIFNLVTTFVVMLTTNWTAASLMRFGREEYDHLGTIRHTFWARTVILTPSLLVGVAGIYLCRGFISDYMKMPSWTLWLVIGSVLVMTARTYVDYILQALHRMRTYAATQLIFTGVFILGLSLIFLGLFPRNYLTVIITGLITSGVTVIFLSLFLVPLGLVLPIETEGRMLREMFSFSYPIVIGNLAAYMVNWIDVVVIKYYFSMSEVGGYQLSYTMFNLLAGFMGSITVLMTPILVSFLAANREDLVSRYNTRLVPQGVLLWATAIGIGLSVCQPIFPILFSEAFGASATYFQFLAMGLVLSGLVNFYSGEITAYKLIKLGMMASVARALANLIGDLLLVPAMGPLGATLATTGGIAIASIFYLMICQRQLRQKLLWQFILIVPTLLSLGVSRTLPGPGAPILAILVTLASSYYLAKTFHLFRSDDLALLEYVQMPVPLKKIIVRIYPLLTDEVKQKRNGGYS
jgi:O-antigen/teichoic acid export membrane protein